jgi:hypothetical protein
MIWPDAPAASSSLTDVSTITGHHISPKISRSIGRDRVHYVCRARAAKQSPGRVSLLLGEAHDLTPAY